MSLDHQNLVIWGATGSIGASALNVIRQAPDAYSVFAISGHQNTDLLIAIALEFLPTFVVVTHEPSAHTVASALANYDIRVVAGAEALIELVQQQEISTVIAGIVGKAGLESTLAAANAGKKILLANKESMVIAGHLFRRAVVSAQARILPIDSEHNAIFQCLPQDVQNTPLISQGLAENYGVHNLVLTASGGPFLNMNPLDLVNVTPAAACRHPNWSMGAKVSIDSASLMNKGLELIEACYLFGVDESFVKVVIHPQSIVHSMVTYLDGTTLAHLSQPSMEVPIAHGLAWPKRHATAIQPIAWDQVLQLDFLPLDLARFPCFRLAREAMHSAQAHGSAAPAVLNAANEVAVDAFVAGHIGFMDIPCQIEKCLEQFGSLQAVELPDLLSLDLEVRQFAKKLMVPHGAKA